MFSKIPKYVPNASKEGPPKTDDEKLKYKAETSEIDKSANQKEISRKHELPQPNPMISDKKTVSFYGVFTSTPKPTLNENVKLGKLKHKTEQKLENLRNESTAKGIFPQKNIMTLNKALTTKGKCSEPTGNSQASGFGCAGLKFYWAKNKLYPPAPAKTNNTVGVRQISEEEIKAGISNMKILEENINNERKVDFSVPQTDSKIIHKNKKFERQRSFKKPFTSMGFVASSKSNQNGEVKLRRSKTETDIKYVRKSSKLSEVKSTNEMVAFNNNSTQNKLSLQKYNLAGLNKNMKKDVESTTSSQGVSSTVCDGLKLDWNKAPSSKITRPAKSFNRRRSKSEVDIKALFKNSKVEIASEKEKNEKVCPSDEYGDNLDFNTFISQNFRKSIADGDIDITPIPKHNVAHTGLKFNFRKSKCSFNFNLKPRSLDKNFYEKSKIN